MKKIALISPALPPSLNGNAVDVERWKRELEKKGKTVRLFLSSDKNLKDKLSRFKPDVAHVIHASKGARAIKFLKKLEIPVVLTLAGPDINVDMEDKRRRHLVVDSFHAADQVIVFYNRLKVDLMMKFPRLRNKMNVINKEIDLPKSGLDFRKKYKFAKDDFIFYLPASIESIKNPLFPVKPLHRLFDQYPNVRFVVSGPIVEKGLARKLMSVHKKLAFVKYIKVVPRKHMYAAYRDVDVVLNCSESEGMPTAILESMMLGKAVLAHKIPATEAIIQHNHNGLLYKNEEKFYQLAERLVTSRRLKSRLEKNAYDTYRFFYTNKQEVQRIMKVYAAAIEANKVALEKAARRR
ncbi:glycosyltransferase [Candidatus Woesearchaeota archaeon]|nr:MAG: glycosyltransferase [Candidatus Woesearchaeota archaeon]